MTRILYLVHNVDDAAVRKRISLFRLGGAKVLLAGFERFMSIERAQDPESPLVIGRTEDAKFLHRALAVLKTLLWPCELLRAISRADALVCRNLEMLVLGYGIRLMSGRRVALTYECLDIHRQMLGRGKVTGLLRSIERFLLSKCHALVTSSPAFVENYFSSIQGYRGRTLLIENKVLPQNSQKAVLSSLTGEIWTIGWFGIIRCRKSLSYLIRLLEEVPNLKVIIAGRVALHEFEAFEDQIRDTDRLEFLGPYTSDTLAEIYAKAHFVWAIDYFEEGLNSTWLLPNRLYDACANLKVPIALNTVETGAWLKKYDAGLCIDDPAPELVPILNAMTVETYDLLKRRIELIPQSSYTHSVSESKTLVEALI